VPEQFDVVIVGGGTAGSYAAYHLAKLGLRVALVESKREELIGVKTCGDGLGKHHVERMSKFLTPNPRVFANEIRGVELHSPDAKTKLVIKGEGFVLDRFEWGKWLVREAVNAGAILYEGHTATRPIVEGSSVVGVKASDNRSGSFKEFRARVVVDASGSAAVIRSKLPEEWPISEKLSPEDVSHAFREIVYVEEPIEDPNFIRIYLDADIAPGGYWWIFPRSPTLLNVGLGVWGISGVNPVENYKKYLAPKFKISRKYHVGGGFIPTRRPLRSLVGNGVVALGDAAAAVNPIHGGGIGQALLTGELAARAISRAFELGDFSERTLWEFNTAYMREWGYRQAQLDVLRLMLQTLNNDDLNYGLSRRILNEDEIYAISAKGVELSLVDKLKLAFQFVTKIPLLIKLTSSLEYAKRIGDLYLRYPTTPDKLAAWHDSVLELYGEFRRKIGLPLWRS